MLDAYIYGGLRTPFGRHGGALAQVRPDDLAGGLLMPVMTASRAPGADRLPHPATQEPALRRGQPLCGAGPGRGRGPGAHLSAS